MFDNILNAIQAIGRFSEQEKSLFMGKLQAQSFSKQQNKLEKYAHRH